MTLKTGQQWSGLVVTLDATGAKATPSVGPAGALYVDGVANAAAVTISGANPYKWTVTLPALTAGQTVSMYITATVSTIATAAVVAEEISDTNRLSDIDISPTGEVGLNFDNIKAATAPTTLTNITVPTTTAVTNTVGANLLQILGTALTETIPTQIAAAFKKFFDKTGPTGTINSLPDVVPGLANGLPILGTNATGMTLGQVKITANVAGEGALDIRNANAAGIGQLNSGESGVYNVGVDYGQYNSGGGVGLYNSGTGLASAGQANMGVAQGEYNLGGAYGQFNSGDNYGQANTGTAAAGVGQLNNGTVDGQFNNGGTYGMQNTGASGQVNVGTAGDGIYASGTDHGVEITGTVSALSDNILAEFFTVDSGETSATAVNGSVVAEVSDLVWDELMAGHAVPGSTGATLNAAGTAGDPWLTLLPGAYLPGTAGDIIGNLTPTVFPAGAINFTYTVTDSVTTLPIEGVEVWISTDNPAVNIVWKGDTDAFGVARDVNGAVPALDVGVYFFWRQKVGYTFTDPDSETVS